MICLWRWAQSTLKSARADTGIWKKTWSLTHLMMGLMPSARIMLLAGSAQAPYTPAEGARPKTRQVSMLKASLSTLTTVPFHCDGWSGIIQYASASSLAAACEPCGSHDMQRAMVEKVPHVHG